MKKVVTVFVALCLILSLYSGAAFAEEKKTELAEDSKSAILIERDTGTVLYEKNKDEKYSPASMTKIMTMLLIMEAIDSGKIKMDEKVTTSEYAASMGGSQIFLEPGEEMTVEELLLAMAIGSANDASVALAEKIAGSEEAFVDMMNERTKELGLKNTHFKNTTGLPIEDHYSTAHDMAIMAKELLKHEEITNFTKNYEAYLREDTDNKFWLVNTNKLVKFYPGVDGLKTGYTSEAKYCLTATAKKDGMRVIAVVFGAPTSKSRNAQITKMLDYSFSQYATHPLYEKGKAIEKAKVSKGSKKYIEAVTGENASVLTKKGEKLDKLTEEIELNEHLKAPIKKGEQIGVLKVKKEGKELIEVPLVAKENVERASWWQLYKRSFGLFTKTD
ncbi:D-alanyl-D-alanine carboxypeptidase family protein [Lederbergia galactosidilytica]|uniref:serine-type D-Ala-D-Ala carboxypeptidase n=1 Tax=Lederbergia galactosidilytica TaxID=217031 RepID=A0A178A793_9BACI|nr:D-alanyl-D-alanine carboxypeptidase family protein [Lederbergia galactosidilytica]KRG08722.1 D-alanyl-D-alanine carboxypeptidase [Virgibacillus soli]MBP1914692.1 D-alanyl-D-alanine carboxypeptidase (penicillin-binding protein 5/6) [Lederbergia galactosidilytica]OAK75350.1 D-alanyl-D-alanine carboxypeptidase [Lederbergia galactosidilytica]